MKTIQELVPLIQEWAKEREIYKQLTPFDELLKTHEEVGAFYHLDINEGHTFSHFAKKYEKAREGLVMKLIEVHKEFGNNIKRK